MHTKPRVIRPEFLINGITGPLPSQYKVIYLGLCFMADKEGKLKDDPFMIKVLSMPYEDIDINDALNKISDMRLIIRYGLGKEKYIKICNFADNFYQHKNEKVYGFPDPLSDKGPQLLKIEGDYNN